MPELPEVETVRRQLLKKVKGKKIKGLEVFHNKTVGHDEAIEEKLVGKTIADIERVGKLMIFSFKHEKDLFVLAHLKMTGQFFYAEDDEVVIGGGHSMSDSDVAEFPGRHTRLAIYFSDNSTLYFNDMRLFGYVKVVGAELKEKAKAGFGPEPIDKAFDTKWFVEATRKRNAPIKAVLLDQAFVSGLGNIYVDEALWRSYVRPTRKANKLTKKEAKDIAVEAGKVMLESIKAGGTTFQSFADTRGQRGNFRDQLRVFGKQDTPCPRCGTLIKKIRLAGRGTHYCPKCQK